MAVYDRTRIEAGINELESVISKAHSEGQTTHGTIEKIRDLLAELEKSAS